MYPLGCCAMEHDRSNGCFVRFFAIVTNMGTKMQMHSQTGGLERAPTGLLQLQLAVFKVHSQELAMAVRIGKCQSMLCM